MRLVDVEFELPQGRDPSRTWSALIGRRPAADRCARRHARGRNSRRLCPAISNSSIARSREFDAANLATGRRFIEWGSGIGVVTCLAACVGFDAVGIEIEPKLVDIAEAARRRHMASTSNSPAAASCPHGVEPRVDWADDVAWLSTTGPDGYEELELEPDDFDVVFAYPWPGEEQVIFDLFADTRGRRRAAAHVPRPGRRASCSAK